MIINVQHTHWCMLHGDVSHKPIEKDTPNIAIPCAKRIFRILPLLEVDMDRFTHVPTIA